MQITWRGAVRNMLPVDESLGMSTVRAMVSADESVDESADESPDTPVGELLGAWLGDRDTVGTSVGTSARISEGTVDAEGGVDTARAGVAGGKPLSRSTGHTS